MPEITRAENNEISLDEWAATEADPRQQKRYYFHATFVRRAVIALVRWILKLTMQIEVSGVEHLPAGGPVVMAANHVTNFDVFPIQICLPRPLFFMAKSELHANPLMDGFLRLLGAFPVYRGQRDAWALAHAVKVLEHQQVLAIFPEGSRSKGRGLRPAKTGAARFSIQTKCPILPVAISGTERMFKDFPRRTPVTIRIGEPLYPRPNESALALTDRLMFMIAGMLPEKQRGVYAERPAGFD